MTSGYGGSSAAQLLCFLTPLLPACRNVFSCSVSIQGSKELSRAGKPGAILVSVARIHCEGICGGRCPCTSSGLGLNCRSDVGFFLLTSPLCLQGIESENVNVVKRLFKIQNLNASTIRTVMVADCSRYDSPDLLLDYEEQLAASSSCPVFDLGSDSEEEEAKPTEPAVQDLPAAGGVPAGHGLQQLFDDLLEGRVGPAMTETQLETKVAELFVRSRTKPPEPNLLPTDSSSKTKYLIFTTGCLTYSPHQIGEAGSEPEAAGAPWGPGLQLCLGFGVGKDLVSLLPVCEV